MTTLSVGKAIKKIRLEKRVKQGELAASIGVSQPYITQIESGKRTVSIEKLKVIAEALSVPVSKIASPDELAIIQNQSDFGEYEKNYLLRKEIEAYTHLFDDDPKISRDSEFGKFIYGSGFQDWFNGLLNGLFRMEKHEREVILASIQGVTDSLFNNMANMTQAQRHEYKNDIQLIYALGMEFHKIKNKSKYINFVRWVQSALLSYASDDIKDSLNAMLLNLLNDEWNGGDKENGDEK